MEPLGESTVSEIKNKVEGRIKKTAGAATGDRSLEARGERQRAVGKVQEGGRKLGGAVDESIGKLTGNRGQQARGRARRD